MPYALIYCKEVTFSPRCAVVIASLERYLPSVVGNKKWRQGKVKELHKVGKKGWLEEETEKNWIFSSHYNVWCFRVSEAEITFCWCQWTLKWSQHSYSDFTRFTLLTDRKKTELTAAHRICLFPNITMILNRRLFMLTALLCILIHSWRLQMKKRNKKQLSSGFLIDSLPPCSRFILIIT